MRRVGAFEAKTHLSQLLDEIERARSGVVIQRRGKDVAALVPCGQVLRPVGPVRKEDLLAALNEIRAIQRKRTQGGEGGKAKDYIKEGRKR